MATIGVVVLALVAWLVVAAALALLLGQVIEAADQKPPQYK